MCTSSLGAPFARSEAYASWAAGTRRSCSANQWSYRCSEDDGAAGWGVIIESISALSCRCCLSLTSAVADAAAAADDDDGADSDDDDVIGLSHAGGIVKLIKQN